MLYHKDITLSWGGKPTPLVVGQRVRTRGDIGRIGHLRVKTVHNDWYCSCVDQWGVDRHFNMAFLEPDGQPDFALTI